MAGGFRFAAGQGHSSQRIALTHSSQLATRNLEPAIHNVQRAPVIIRSVKGTPVENMTKVIELLGGIEKIIGSNDVVLIKSNVQWWNQGAPNLAAISAFVGLIMGRPGGFRGEVVMADSPSGATPPPMPARAFTNFRICGLGFS